VTANTAATQAESRRIDLPMRDHRAVLTGASELNRHAIRVSFILTVTSQSTEGATASPAVKPS
jgi:hypothetical protein